MIFFKGEFDSSAANSTVLKAVVHWNYASISRDPNSLCGKLIHEDGGNGYRTWSIYCPITVNVIVLP